MPHIHTNPGEYDHTVSAFLFRVYGDEPRLVLHLHKKLHVYIQFGGHIEINENPWQAITHELEEESGYKMSQLKILQPKQRMKSMSKVKVHPMPIYHQTHTIDTGDLNGVHYHTDIAYAFITNDEPKLKIGDSESHKTKLLTRNELLNEPSEITFESVREAGLYVFDVCLNEWEAVNPAIFD
jgi:ADP-ribose pyrophosphatase YjhB (NUDIX family)